MATKFSQVSGDYDKKVYDSGDACKDYLMDSPGQGKEKFSKPANGVEYSSKQPSQKENKIIDSKDAKVGGE